MLPIKRFVVKGHSMEPHFRDGDRLLINKWAYLFSKSKIGDVIVFKSLNSKKFVLKRVQRILSNGYFVQGDNKFDSRYFGAVSRNQILGKVLTKY